MRKSTLTGVVIFLFVLGLNLIWVPYGYGSVEKDYNAEIAQCENIVENYKDVESDLINYERTNTDNLGLHSQADFERCLKIFEDKEWYLHGEYLGFWTILVVEWIFVLGIISVVIVMVRDGNRYDSDEIKWKWKKDKIVEVEDE